MQNSLTDISSDCIQTVMDGLRKNNMDVQYVPHKEEAAAAVASLLKEGDTIAVGGSVTLEETGVLELVQNGRYHFIDRYEDGLSDRERKDRLTEAFRSDVFLCSANAITKNGEIYQVDGLSNRIAPLVFGPDSVIIVAGINKIAADIEAAVYRVKTVTVPAIVKEEAWMRPAPVWEAASRPTRRTWLPDACVMQGAAAIIWCSDARESKAVSKSFSLEKL